MSNHVPQTESKAAAAAAQEAVQKLQSELEAVRDAAARWEAAAEARAAEQATLEQAAIATADSHAALQTELQARGARDTREIWPPAAVDLCFATATCCVLHTVHPVKLLLSHNNEGGQPWVAGSFPIIKGSRVKRAL